MMQNAIGSVESKLNGLSTAECTLYTDIRCCTDAKLLSRQKFAINHTGLHNSDSARSTSRLRKESFKEVPVLALVARGRACSAS